MRRHLTKINNVFQSDLPFSEAKPHRRCLPFLVGETIVVEDSEDAKNLDDGGGVVRAVAVPLSAHVA